MNKKEFMEVQEQMAKSLIVYERFLKKANILKARYNSLYKKYLSDEISYRLENDFILKIIQMKNQNKSSKEIEDVIAKGKVMYDKTILDLSKEYEHDEMVLNSMASVDLDMFDKAYDEYVRVNHPAIKMAVTNNEAQLYNVLRGLYTDNNYSGFLSVLEMNQAFISSVEYTEDKYTEYYKYYIKTAGDIQKDLQKRLNAFPFNKEEIFKDDMSIAAEEAELKIRINHLAAINKALHSDLINSYGKDINYR